MKYRRLPAGAGKLPAHPPAGSRRYLLRRLRVAPDEAAPILRRALARFLARPLMAPMLRGWYGLDASSTDADYLARASEHPMFELKPIGAWPAEASTDLSNHEPEGRAA